MSVIELLEKIKAWGLAEGKDQGLAGYYKREDIYKEIDQTLAQLQRVDWETIAKNTPQFYGCSKSEFYYACRYLHAQGLIRARDDEALKALEWKPIEEFPKEYKDGREFIGIVDGEMEKCVFNYNRFYVVNNGDYCDGGYGNDYEIGRYQDEYVTITDFLPTPPKKQSERR